MVHSKFQTSVYLGIDIRQDMFLIAASICFIVQMRQISTSQKENPFEIITFNCKIRF